MSDVVFVDSNILIYAHDADAGPKRARAVERLAIDIAEMTQLMFWDALIIASAEHVQATYIYSEDLNAGQTIAGVQIFNPLVA